jgi:hypothetical protein
VERGVHGDARAEDRASGLQRIILGHLDEGN